MIALNRPPHFSQKQPGVYLDKEIFSDQASNSIPFKRDTSLVPQNMSAQVFKVAKLLAPSVIYIEDVEKVMSTHV